MGRCTYGGAVVGWVLMWYRDTKVPVKSIALIVDAASQATGIQPSTSFKSL
jgi:hypothetical protein